MQLKQAATCTPTPTPVLFNPNQNIDTSHINTPNGETPNAALKASVMVNLGIHNALMQDREVEEGDKQRLITILSDLDESCLDYLIINTIGQCYQSLKRNNASSKEKVVTAFIENIFSSPSSTPTGNVNKLAQSVSQFVELLEKYQSEVSPISNSLNMSHFKGSSVLGAAEMPLPPSPLAELQKYLKRIQGENTELREENEKLRLKVEEVSRKLLESNTALAENESLIKYFHEENLKLTQQLNDLKIQALPTQNVKSSKRKVDRLDSPNKNSEDSDLSDYFKKLHLSHSVPASFPNSIVSNLNCTQQWLQREQQREVSAPPSYVSHNYHYTQPIPSSYSQPSSSSSSHSNRNEFPKNTSIISSQKQKMVDPDVWNPSFELQKEFRSQGAMYWDRIAAAMGFSSDEVKNAITKPEVSNNDRFDQLIKMMIDKEIKTTDLVKGLNKLQFRKMARLIEDNS